MKKTVFYGLLAILLAFGMVFVGCNNDTGDDGNGASLPAPKGTNAVSGKTYYEYSERTVFSATSDGASNGTYTVGRTVYNDTTHQTELVDGKYKYSDNETGTYTWNEDAKTVTLKPEKLLSQDENGNLLDKAGYKAAYTTYMNTMLASQKEQQGWTQEQLDEYIKKQLAAMGYSSLQQYIDETANEAFSNRTNGYSFSTDGNALFLEEALPANKGTNEFTGQTYNGLTWNSTTGKNEKDSQQVYVFTATDYTFTSSRYGTTVEDKGSYAYDSNLKRVWIRPSTKDGKTRDAYYTAQTPSGGHNYADDNAYRAAQTNDAFRVQSNQYNSTNKTIGWED